MADFTRFSQIKNKFSQDLQNLSVGPVQQGVFISSPRSDNFKNTGQKFETMVVKYAKKSRRVPWSPWAFVKTINYL